MSDNFRAAEHAVHADSWCAEAARASMAGSRDADQARAQAARTANQLSFEAQPGAASADRMALEAQPRMAAADEPSLAAQWGAADHASAQSLASRATAIDALALAAELDAQGWARSPAFLTRDEFDAVGIPLARFWAR